MRLAALILNMWAAVLTGCAATPAPGPAPTAPPEDPRGSLQVLGHHCDGGQGVDALAVIVEKPGPVVLRWSNEGVCGRPA